jgi:hypothetical protein
MPATLEDIAPGSQVHVKITASPTNEAAVKTIARVLAKDAVHAAEQKRIEKVRQSQYNPTPRGGRLYGGRQVKLRPVKSVIGEQGTVLATPAVIADLKSVARFVEVTKA